MILAVSAIYLYCNQSVLFYLHSFTCKIVSPKILFKYENVSSKYNKFSDIITKLPSYQCNLCLLNRKTNNIILFLFFING